MLATCRFLEPILKAWFEADAASRVCQLQRRARRLHAFAEDASEAGELLEEGGDWEAALAAAEAEGAEEGEEEEMDFE